MRSSVSFCCIAARIQDRMARLPMITLPEIEKLDTELLEWRRSLDPVMRNNLQAPEQVRAACLLLHYRFLNQRMILYRPYLLIHSIKANPNEDSPSESIISTAHTCCEIAQDSIRFIAESWYPNQLLAWNSSWFLFQAALVVLLTLISAQSPDQNLSLESSIIQCLTHLDQMRRWRGPAAQTHDLISFIFNARENSKNPLESECSLPEEAFADLLDFGSTMIDGDWAALPSTMVDFSPGAYGLEFQALL